MRFPSRLISSVTVRPLRLLLSRRWSQRCVSGAGCEDKHIGRPCELGASAADAGTGSTAVITSPALECPSRICVLPGAETGSRQHGCALHRLLHDRRAIAPTPRARAPRTRAASSARKASFARGRRPLAPSVARRCASAATSWRRTRAESRDPAGLHQSVGRRVPERAMSVGAEKRGGRGRPPRAPLQKASGADAAHEPPRALRTVAARA